MELKDKTAPQEPIEDTTGDQPTHVEVQANFATGEEEAVAYKHDLDAPFTHNDIVYVMRMAKRNGGRRVKTLMVCSDQSPVKRTLYTDTCGDTAA